MNKELDEAKKEVARLTELNLNAVIFKAELADEGVPSERKPKTKKAKKQ